MKRKLQSCLFSNNDGQCRDQGQHQDIKTEIESPNKKIKRTVTSESETSEGLVYPNDFKESKKSLQTQLLITKMTEIYSFLNQDEKLEMVQKLFQTLDASQLQSVYDPILSHRKPNSNGNLSIACLDKNLLNNVLNYLSEIEKLRNIELVCRKWQNYSQNGCGWTCGTNTKLVLKYRPREMLLPRLKFAGGLVINAYLTKQNYLSPIINTGTRGFNSGRMIVPKHFINFDWVAQCSRLKCLKIRSFGSQSSNLSALIPLSHNLRKLSIKSLGTASLDMASLSSLSQLTFLILQGGVESKDIHFFSKFKQLKMLDISGLVVKKLASIAIIEGFKEGLYDILSVLNVSITKLIILFNDSDSSDSSVRVCAQALSRFENLQHLVIRCNNREKYDSCEIITLVNSLSSVVNKKMLFLELILFQMTLPMRNSIKQYKFEHLHKIETVSLNCFNISPEQMRIYSNLFQQVKTLKLIACQDVRGIFENLYFNIDETKQVDVKISTILNAGGQQTPPIPRDLSKPIILSTVKILNCSVPPNNTILAPALEPLAEAPIKYLEIAGGKHTHRFLSGIKLMKGLKTLYFNGMIEDLHKEILLETVSKLTLNKLKLCVNYVGNEAQLIGKAVLDKNPNANILILKYN